MADVFVSYKREDRTSATLVVDALRNAGYSVWWDEDLTPRTTWDAEIERELEASKAVLVLWTERSAAQGTFVRNEAHYALKEGKLVPVRLDKCRLPLAFQTIQTADLISWDLTDQHHPGWRQTLSWLSNLVGHQPEWILEQDPVSQVAIRRVPKLLPHGLIVGIMLIALAIGLTIFRPSPGKHAIEQGAAESPLPSPGFHRASFFGPWRALDPVSCASASFIQISETTLVSGDLARVSASVDGTTWNDLYSGSYVIVGFDLIISSSVNGRTFSLQGNELLAPSGCLYVRQ
jgi:hypothetical protein